MSNAPICPACDTPARLTDGREIYPHRPDLADKPIWACAICEDTYVGCHPGTENPLGTPADAGLREARMLLHRNRIDPLWKTADRTVDYRPKGDEDRKFIRKVARSRVYGFLAERMGLTRDTCHTGMFTLEQCREAYRALNRVTYPEIRAWAQTRPGSRSAKKARAAA
ncbi:zinc-finger-containing protein [Methylobacterium sp. HMF5984]|uniref:zinc-finger-containing protein n=1 Tax=Methylobacterium sp. HMF5984 TaxID=3367370 RepID=UPI0038521EA9